jgi:hypothetical protein
MLIRIFIRYYKIILLLLMPVSIQAEESNNVIIGYNNLIMNKIDEFFLTQTQKKNVIWTPIIEGKSKYAFSIPKDAYLRSVNHGDSSDLYYLSEKIDTGLNFQPNNSKNIEIITSENDSQLILGQNILSNINARLFLRNKDRKSFGFKLDKDVIIFENVLGSFGFEQAKGENIVFDAKFVKISNNEDSEFYGNINHKYKSDHLNVGIGNTWFEILNQFDFSVGIQEQDKKVEADLYATFGDKKMKFQIGLNQIKSNSNMNLFFNLKFENILNKKKFGTNLIITSQDSIPALRNLSLKSFRKKNLDNLWRKHINYD